MKAIESYLCELKPPRRDEIYSQEIVEFNLQLRKMHPICPAQANRVSRFEINASLLVQNRGTLFRRSEKGKIAASDVKDYLMCS